MRTVLNLNAQWAFTKMAETVPEKLPVDWEQVNLPHTWNAIDGQDGGNDYYRGTCYYAKNLSKVDLPEADRYYLEFRGANASADLYVNGKHLAHHDGGYSTWRADITDALEVENLIVVTVENGINDRVYPQVADFTFYGGLYRDVNLICVNQSHFDLDYYGGPGIWVTPVMEGDNANVEVEVFLTGSKPSQIVRYTLLDGEDNVDSTAETTGTKVSFLIENAHKWNGRKDPYLYTAKAELLEQFLAGIVAVPAKGIGQQQIQQQKQKNTKN